MAERRRTRVLLEVVFLAALAGALAFAELTAPEIAAVMLLGWVIVAVFEWAAWREVPHFGSGLPPRYQVPHRDLPPALPLEQVAVGYREAYPETYPEAQRDEAPTWIASAALRAEVLGEWPVSAPVAAEPELDEPKEEPVGGWAIDEPEPEPELEPEPEPELPPEPAVVLITFSEALARHTLDPLGDPPARPRFRRARYEAAAAVDVPARPAGLRPLPGRAQRQES